MKTSIKVQARANVEPILASPAQWQAVDAALQALATALAALLRPLTEPARRQLLRVGITNEAFTEEFIAFAKAQPEVIPSVLRPADTLRDWQTRAELQARQIILAQISQGMDDTLAGLSGDCYATALACYRMLVRDGAPPGLSAAVAPLREHMALREERKKHTRTLRMALEEAQAPDAPPANAATLPAASPGASAPSALAA